MMQMTDQLFDENIMDNKASSLIIFILLLSSLLYYS